MKFTPEDYSKLKSAISSINIDLAASKEKYSKKGIGKDPDKRFVWDIFWTTRFHLNFREECDKYLDDHIETATRKAINELISEGFKVIN
jgi:hypothetical protein